MKVKVGSKNQTKIDAVAELLAESALFAGAEVIGVDVSSGTSNHPRSLKETTEGAIARAKKAFVDCDYSFGIEGGLMEAPYTKSGSVQIEVCAIYDGKEIHLGYSQAFEWPKKVAQLIAGGLEASDALRQAGIVKEGSHKIGASEGGIWHLTKGRMNRTGQNKQAVSMALIHLENREHF